MITRRLAILLLLGLPACSQIEQVMNDPPLTPVGAGLAGTNAESVAAVYPVASDAKNGWVGGPADFFRDRRAHRVGDILTVDISIDDKAALSNTTNSSRKSSAAADLGMTYDLMGVVGADINGKGDVNSNSTSAGQGTTARSEKINLSVAAVVTGLLPNGYLLIKGTQEIKVNAETRILSVSGIVHPRDISDRGTVPYDKIAEARISYGGTGSVADVQKPGWGQRIWNKLTPF
jgi:flagellar L-ring protein precursor FlgH